MPLCFGFYYYSRERDKALEKKGDIRHKALSEKDKQFYHNVLCFLLMVVDIGKITKETIPHIIARERLAPVLTYENEDEKPSDEELTKYLSRFIGYEANVSTRNNKEFLAKLGNRLPKWKFKKARYGGYIIDEWDN